MRRLRCAYLTMDDMGDFVSDAEFSFAPMQALGWDVEMVSWRKPGVIWDDYDAVYICTPWDYPDEPETFLNVLTSVDRSTALLINCLELVRWSLEKTYLRDLESRGADIVPSSWYSGLVDCKVPGFFAEHETNTIVIKPTVGANAADTYVLNNPVGDELLAELLCVFDDRPLLVQPFVRFIQSEGEYSLFFFGGNYSHAILKTPKTGDFRVQEEHGAVIESVEPTPELSQTASRVVALVDPQPTYVRADFVRSDDDRFLLMELELIEPSLYFRMDDYAATRFAMAFDAYVRLHAS